MAVVIAVLAFSAFIIGNMAPRLTSIGRPSEQTSFEALDRCPSYAGMSGVQGDLMWDGNKVVSRSGIHYAAADITGLLYGVAPGPIGLRTPVSLGGVTFSSPTREAFTATYFAGFLFMTLTFADGLQRNLTAVIFPPPFKGDTPYGCALLVARQDQQAGILVLFTPSAEPLEYPALGIVTGDKAYQARIYEIVQANPTSTTVTPPPTNPQASNATLEYDLTNSLTENGATCTYGWGPMFTFYRSGEQFSFNYSSTSPIDAYVFDPDDYSGRVRCTFGPILDAPYGPTKLTGKQGRFASVCLGCEKEGGKGSSFYVLFINRDPAVTPHVTLQVAVSSYVAAAVCVPSAESETGDRAPIGLVPY